MLVGNKHTFEADFAVANNDYQLLRLLPPTRENRCGLFSRDRGGKVKQWDFNNGVTVTVVYGNKRPRVKVLDPKEKAIYVCEYNGYETDFRVELLDGNQYGRRHHLTEEGIRESDYFTKVSQLICSGLRSGSVI